jgi:hypothetical protein
MVSGAFELFSKSIRNIYLTCPHLRLHVLPVGYKCPPFKTLFQRFPYRIMKIIKQRQTNLLLSIHLWLYSPLLALGDISVSWSFCAVGRTPLTGDDPVAMPLPTHITTKTHNKHTETSIPWVGIEPTIPGFEDISCLRQHGICDQANLLLISLNRWPETKFFVGNFTILTVGKLYRVGW